MKPIDFVIAWVDVNDKEWKEKKNAYLHEACAGISVKPQGVAQDIRYRDWGFLRFIFRGIECYAPWVNHVYLVTDSQCPKWLNTEYDKITVVDHKDFIPKEYLPTFNSHTIELNLHRIAGLSEQFVYFNDDILLMNPCSPKDFFHNGKPVDEACLNGINGKDEEFAGIQFHNLSLMNRYYDRRAVLSHLNKWLHPAYGFRSIRTLLLLPFQRLQGIFNPHGPMPLLKGTYEKLWERDGKVLDSTCLCRLRTESNVSVYVMRYEQLLSGNFIPAKSGNRYLEVSMPTREIIKKTKMVKSICLNDAAIPQESYLKKKKELTTMLKKKFPQKSAFEL